MRLTFPLAALSFCFARPPLGWGCPFLVPFFAFLLSFFVFFLTVSLAFSGVRPGVPWALAPSVCPPPPSCPSFFLRPRCLLLSVVSGPGCPGPWRCVLLPSLLAFPLPTPPSSSFFFPGLWCPPPLVLFFLFVPPARFSVCSCCFYVSCLATGCSLVVAAPPSRPPFCVSRFLTLPLGATFFFLFSFFSPFPLRAPVVPPFLWIPAPGALGLGAVCAFPPPLLSFFLFGFFSFCAPVVSCFVCFLALGALGLGAVSSCPLFCSPPPSPAFFSLPFVPAPPSLVCFVGLPCSVLCVLSLLLCFPPGRWLSPCGCCTPPPRPFMFRGFRRCRSVLRFLLVLYFSSLALLLPACLAPSAAPPPPPLVCCVGLPLLGSPCAPAVFVFPARPLAAPLWLLPPPPPLSCLAVFVAAVRCSGFIFVFLFFLALLLPACRALVGGSRRLLLPPPPPGARWCLVPSGVAALRCPSVRCFAVPCCRVPCCVSCCGAPPWCVVGCCAVCGVCWGVCLCVVLCCWLLLRVLPCPWSCCPVGLFAVWCAFWFWSALPCAVLCYVLGAVPCRAAARCAARCCAVVCCVVLFCLFSAAACCAVPSGAAPRHRVLCFAVLCFAVLPRAVCSVLCVFCPGVLVCAVVRRCALCCVCPGVSCCAFPVLSPLCGAVLCCAGALALCCSFGACCWWRSVLWCVAVCCAVSFGVLWCGAGSGGQWLSSGGVFRFWCPCLAAWPAY